MKSLQITSFSSTGMVRYRGKKALEVLSESLKAKPVLKGKEMSKTTIKVQASVRIPRAPNYLIYGDGDGQNVDVKDVSDSDLERLGKEWTKQLIEHAKRRRDGE